ncbi:flavodoxin domain-containing protein [Candidatus Gottesmanbacteria bacterium]|nr:flavodoxin domain-containing protein [Candidatus Gottesmanbacteria bacterium]
MNILLIYASNSGGTFLSSGIIVDVLKKHQHSVVVKNVREADPSEIGNYDLIILGSPSWDYQGKEGQPHQDYLPFLEKAKDKNFPGKPFAIYGLGDSSFAYFTGAVDHLENFVKNIGGKLITTSLRIDGFYFDQENNEKKVTDWAEDLATKIA